MTTGKSDKSVLTNMRLGGAVLMIFGSSIALFYRLAPMLLPQPHIPWILASAVAVTLVFLWAAFFLNKAWVGITSALILAAIILSGFVIFSHHPASIDATESGSTYDVYDPPRPEK